MHVSEDFLKSQLVEYRKAFRAMMSFYDSSWSLFNLFNTELIGLFENVEECSLSDEIDENWDKPLGISFEALRDVTDGVYNWLLTCYSNQDSKAKKNSIYLSVGLYLDLWPTIAPAESISAILIHGYRMNNINGKATHHWYELEDNFNNCITDENGIIDKDGEPQKPMPIKVFPNIWSSMNNKYQGDYATGMYDLSNLIDENTVKNTIISDIKKLITEWSS